MRARRTDRTLLGALAVVSCLGWAATFAAQPAAAAGTPLVGTFTITAGSCSGGVVSGTYLRMVLSGGTNAAGPYFSNSDSSCPDNTYTPLAPGTAGGLVTGSYQAQPSPAFDSAGNALSADITAPVAFEGVKFSTATNPVDPQTGLHTPPPSIAVSGTVLSGNLQSFGVSWNKQEFNQGSPKPDGSAPGNTTPVTGAYNPASGVYTLQWSSQVVGGPFNGFSAYWNLTGHFVPAAGANASGSAAGTTAANGPGGVAGTTSSGSGTQGGATAAGSPRSTPDTAGAPGAPATGGTATSATTTPGATSGARTTSSHTVQSVRTVVGSTGWQAPSWLVALVALLAVSGLFGVLWSERELRRRRRDENLELKGA